MQVNSSPDMGFYHESDRVVKGATMQGIRSLMSPNRTEEDGPPPDFEKL